VHYKQKVGTEPAVDPEAVPLVEEGEKLNIFAYLTVNFACNFAQEHYVYAK